MCSDEDTVMTQLMSTRTGNSCLMTGLGDQSQKTSTGTVVDEGVSQLEQGDNDGQPRIWRTHVQQRPRDLS